ncbi:uncharacterized protein LOC144007613 [Festucalex cinctus]
MAEWLTMMSPDQATRAEATRQSFFLTSDSIASSSSSCCSARISTRSSNTLTSFTTKARAVFRKVGIFKWSLKWPTCCLYLQHNGQIDCKKAPKWLPCFRLRCGFMRCLQFSSC